MTGPRVTAINVDTTWITDATCRAENLPTAMFFDEALYIDARAVCDRCPVTEQCLTFGRATKSEGVFGGVFLQGLTHSAASQRARRRAAAPADATVPCPECGEPCRPGAGLAVHRRRHSHVVCQDCGDEIPGTELALHKRWFCSSEAAEADG